MELRRLLALGSFSSGAYRRAHGISAADIARARWRKSSISSYNGSCLEVARLASDRVGVRDTKDREAGPVLVFNQAEWVAFLGGAKAGEFDSI